jgi:hypothetical protein
MVVFHTAFRDAQATLLIDTVDANCARRIVFFRFE